MKQRKQLKHMSKQGDIIIKRLTPSQTIPRYRLRLWKKKAINYRQQPVYN